jgi:hypothetical protein
MIMMRWRVEIATDIFNGKACQIIECRWKFSMLDFGYRVHEITQMIL